MPATYSRAAKRQQAEKSFDEYPQALKTLSKDCNIKTATAGQCRDESIQEVFIAGLLSNSIRQRLLELRIKR